MILSTQRIGILFLTLFVLACSGAKGPDRPDPMALLMDGKFNEARAAVEGRGPVDTRDRAIVAICLIAENPTKERAFEAVAAISNGTNGIESAATSLELLDLAFKIPAPVEYDVSMYLVEVALGSVGHGPFAQTTSTVSVGAASRSLAVSILERTHFALTGTEVFIDTDRLLAIWNGCFTLLGASFVAEDDVEAWRMFRSLGNVAVWTFKAAPDADLSTVLMEGTISVIESNPSIGIPVKCDLSSPFDDLRSVLGHERELLVRLEKSVADAAACSRGTYAPTSL